MYMDSMKPAFTCGLRLIVASAVNSERLADLYDDGNPIDTSAETSIASQLAGMKAFAAQYSDWMQVVTSPDEARAAIVAGKLAVVLAIEVDSIAAGRLRHGDSLPTADLDAIVQAWWAKNQFIETRSAGRKVRG